MTPKRSKKRAVSASQPASTSQPAASAALPQTPVILPVIEASRPEPKGHTATEAATGNVSQSPAGLRPVRLEFSAPKAQAVYVAGSFNGWNPAATLMTRHSEAAWTTELNLPSGRHEYRFVVDGTWVEPPGAQTYVANPHGSRNAVVEL